jgi:hypothetical protein
MTATLPLVDIRVGGRTRRDMDDIAGLAASINELGLLQPIVVRPDRTLIAGERRLRAAEQLGWTEIPVNVVDLDRIARREFAENAMRKDFALSESVAIKRALEPIERAAAKERMLADKPLGKFPKGRPRQCSEGGGQGSQDHREGGGYRRCVRGRAGTVRQAQRADGPHRVRYLEKVGGTV